jgi:hypothetical protein
MTRRLRVRVTLAVLAVTLTACASAFYPPTYAPPVVYAPPYAPPPSIVPPAPEAPYGEPPLYGTPPVAQPGAAPGAHAGMCDMQGHCYNNGPPQQVYHGDPAHPDKITGPPPEVTNHPPLVVPPPSNDDGAPQ